MRTGGVTSAIVLICVLVVVQCFEFTTAEDLSSDFLLRQFFERYQPAILIRPSFRRVRRFDYTYGNDEEAPARLKRNNAEVVNHIIKNFGTLDRLGDVGK
ncbi:hypothetical protein M3Y94_00788400 [Aphelenchoides besseyi]|nr:hypothetical protein M3Y94_00788400 [Aphelenchoides besseyi]KAI6232423.1 hypothetical protein M3Y95_00484300 [Aphelenchoides besseyi]